MSSAGRNQQGRGLSDLLNHELGDSGNDILSNSHVEEIASEFSDYESARSALSSLFWGALLRLDEELDGSVFPRSPTGSYSTRYFEFNLPDQSLLRGLFASLPFDSEVELAIISHGAPTQYDLVVLAPDWTNAPQSFSLSPEYAMDEVRRARRDSGRAFGTYQSTHDRGSFPGILPYLSNDQIDDLLVSLAKSRNWGIVLGRLPRIEPTSGFSPAVSVVTSSQKTATAGLVVVGRDRTLVSTAAHAVDGSDMVWVGSSLGYVVSRSEATDSCIIELGSSKQGELLLPRSGMLLRKPPRSPDQAWFDGARSGHRQTVIRGHDPSIAIGPQQFFANKVYTDNDTNEGDSGAALIDDDGRVVGFAAYRTAFGEDPSYSLWIWAVQVCECHERVLGGSYGRA